MRSQRTKLNLAGKYLLQGSICYRGFRSVGRGLHGLSAILAAYCNVISCRIFKHFKSLKHVQPKLKGFIGQQTKTLEEKV